MSTLSLLRDQVGILDDGQGVRVIVETLDGKNAYASALDGQESQTLRWAMQVNDVEGVRLERDQACRERDIAVEQRRAAEEANRKGVARLAEAMAGIDRLTAEKKALETKLAEALTIRASIPRAAGLKYPAWETSGGPNECSHGIAEGIPCERCDKATRDALEAELVAVRKDRATWLAACEKAEARIKALETSAEPVAWYFPNGNGDVETVRWNTEPSSPAWLPLYRHPPKPAGHPVAYRIGSGKNMWFTTELSAALAATGREVVALYEAPPAAQAIGVTDERFAVVKHEPFQMHFEDLTKYEGGYPRNIGSREDAKRCIGRVGNGDELVRIVPADAPVVDLDAVRDAIGVLDVANLPLANKLRAAIGDR